MIQIKRNNKVFFTLEDFGEGSKLSYQLMDHHYIILKFTTATPIYFEIGDSVEIPDFGYFELTSSYFPKHNDSDGYDYEMQMDAYYMSWKNKICKYRPQHGANETSFNLTTTVGVHMNVILGNLKALGLTYNGKEFSVDYTTYNNKAFDVQKRFLIEYGSISILDALNAICSEDALNCEWWIDGSIIYLGYCEMEGQTTFEQDVNVLSMSYSESKSTYITRLYAFGSDRNIPKGYFTGADADVTTDGVATDYLMLPNKEVDSDGFYAKDGYLENVNVVKNDKQAIEGVVMFEEEYPKVESVVSSIKTYDSTVDNEDGTKTTQTFWQVTSTDSFTNSFKESWIKSNLTLGIKFTSGALMGMEFDVSFKVIDKVNYFEIVANDTYGRTLPDGVMCPKVGDKYFLFNWDATKITDTDLIPTAQLSLFDRAKQYYQKTMISNSNFTCTMDGDKFYNDGTYDYHPLGEQVKLINDMFAQVDADGKHYRNSRIIGMEIPLDIPYDHPQYTVGEKAATSRLGKLEDKVDSIKVNGMQIGGTGSGNGGGVYVIGMNDTTPASDSNVYSARRSRMEFVSRLQDNIAKGTITWEKVQKFFSGLHVGNPNNENGGSWTPDAEGRSHLITDYLEVRMKAIFEELVINKTSTIGGKEIISPAGGVVAHKVEEVTVTYNNVSQKAYRCYFLAEQEGDAVDNDFAVGDQVRSESFNVRKGTYHKAGNHFYWRLAIGRDEDPVELEGKKYHYIDLSDTDCATASDVPAKGDVLNQCGNRTDVERQNCLIFSAVDTYSPSISLYHGINSYSFANREYVEYGVNKQNNKAFFNVYGDMYVGDRPTKENGYEGSSYIRYDSSTKQMSVKAKISAKSTVDGKELSQYFKKIAELQNQVDGAIETWFYDGVPTLENAPAISWKTDKDKEIHLGDLYYNNKTGKAYRFAKDSNTYKWTIITDTDIAKALSDARMAQETANGKMKVFSVQPTTPYQVGDIWVNATYPSDGSTYKNEVLRCQTNKAAGSQFAIGDWIKASKYTDDTVANAAKKAAEDAQKAAQTAQTDIKNLGNTVTDNKKEFDNYVTDGYLEPSEIAAMAQDSKRLEDDFAAAQKSYNEVKDAEVLKDTKELTDLNTAFATLTSAKTELIKFLSDISKRYNETDTDGKAAIVSAVGMKFTNFQSAYSAFYDKLGLANAYITSKIYGDLKQNITDLAGYKYLKDALGQTTDIDGGLVMTTLLALRDGDGNVQSGINGAIDPNRGKKSIATWWGGQMVDKDYNSGNLTPATSIIRFDGSGYLANGAIWWDVSGKVHADPTSFIISEKNLGAYLIFFEPTWKEGSAGTSVADLVSLKPNAPFSKLGVSGDATFEGAISFHGIKLTYDSTNKAIKIDGNLYTTGGITAYGAGASTTGGGGGLNGSVKSYSSALKLTSESLSEIASAYSIKALDSRISSLEGGSAMNVSVSGSGNAVTAISKSGTTIIVTKGTTFLTSHQSLASYLTRTDAASLYQPKGNYLTAHQSLDGYVNAITTSGSGNAITSVSKSGKGITFTKGATFLTSHQSLANYYTKSSVDSLLSGKSATSHTHSVKINGVTKTIAATGGTAVDLGTYLTSHQSLANYVTINDSRLSDSRYPKFANNTWYLVGDDAYIGDHNIVGTFCIKSANNVNVSGIAIYNSDETKVAKLWFDNTNINLDKQLVMNNKRIWIQGVGTAGGNNNRLTLVAGMPSGLAYNTSCRGTILYSNGIAFADPYNGNSNNDSGWIRHLETSANSGTLEIAVGDDASYEQIHFRWYNTNSSAETIAHDITVPRATGTLALTSQIPTSLKSPNSLSWSGYNTGSYDGSSPKSFVIPSNTNQLTNGAGFITSSASISGNAATATKVNHSLLVFGKSFNGSADVTVADTDLIASISIGTSNVTDKTEILTSYASDNGFNDSNAKNKIHRRPASAIWGYINSKTISNADKLDNVHLNGIFTALSNTNNGVSMTIGTVAKSLANMQVYSATKLVTARNISIAGRDFVGNVNFDGTGNVSLNGAINYCTINIGNTDPNPFKRIAHIKVAHSWNDNALLLYISQGYHGGNFGLCRVEFRTNDIANSDTAGGGVSLLWLIRQGYATDSIQAGYYIHLKNAYVDVFLKTTGAYQGTVIRVIQDSRGSINNSFGLINSTYNTEAYTSLSAAATALYNVAYQGTVSGTDTCTVSHANSATKLQTPRTIWGQSFDGTGNVSGSLSGVGHIQFSADNSYSIGTTTSEAAHTYTRQVWARYLNASRVYAGDTNLYIGYSNTAQVRFFSGTKQSGDGSNERMTISTNGNVGIGTIVPAYKLHVAGDIYSSTIRSKGKNRAIILSNDASPAWISALEGQVIFNTGKAIRFGETALDWNQWAGLKYNHSDKTIYLGIANGSIFNANSPQSDGTLKFPGITTITPDAAARIGGSGGDLYLGNGNNTNWVKVQDMCSQVDSNNWKIMQGGYALFKDITIINTATINGSTHINNLLTAKGIMPTTADVNAFGTNVNNWDGSIAANVTNMFNGIPQENIQVEYSMDNGATWNTYFDNSENRFNLINDNARESNYYLGSNNLLGDTEADKLAQIKKNQLRVTVKIPDEIYQELRWISVDVNNGVDIKCQVYFGSSTGGYKEYVSKIMKGWSHKCDICVGPNNVNVGNDSYRYVRLVFSHLNTHTALRNGIVAKIRALALTKYKYNDNRYTISTTGHIYDYDAYMNTYFPNSILAKGGVTAYQSSDIRLKQDLRKLDYLGIIKAMGGTFSFAWKKDNTRSIGWIAQHVLCNPHLKDIVETDEKGYYKINYWSPKLIATAFGAIEQVGDEVSRLKARVVFLESEVQRLSGDKEDCNKKRLDNKNINSLN